MAATAAGAGKQQLAGAVRQVTKSDFPSALRQLRAHVADADFIAVSMRKTGDCASASSASASASAESHRRPWWRVLPIDTPEIAYLKAKLAAETYEVVQFAVCPFRVLQGSKVVAHPYNFHLFPRDELNIGMPSYSFSCQTSFLTSMAREDFDFNGWIYNGISYLSRVQESKVKERVCIPRIQPVPSCSSPSVADSVFMSRIKSRVEHWRNACKEPANTCDGSLIKTLRKLIAGGEQYGSRPSMSIDVCTDRQVPLALQTISVISDDLVPLVVSDKSGEPRAIRVVLTSSVEDKILLMDEIKKHEDEYNLKVRGFREVIDVISNSCKPVISYNGLHDLTFIHSKFLGPLPPNLREFMYSLRLAFPIIVDVNHLTKEIGPLRKAKNLPSALSYLKRQFFVPIVLELPPQVEGSIYKDHGTDVLRMVRLFSKLSLLLRIVPGFRNLNESETVPIDAYSNILYPICTCISKPGDEDHSFWMDDAKKVSTDNLLFLWGYNDLLSAEELQYSLRQAHLVFREDFEMQFIDRGCAVVFLRPGCSKVLLEEIESGSITSDALSDMISDGLKVTGYDAYRKVCDLGLWEAELSDSLDRILSEQDDRSLAFSVLDASEVYWTGQSVINFEDL